MIEKDTVVAGNLLRVVNSALYGFRGTISSVAHAISILGLDKLRNIVLAMSLARMWHQAAAAKGWAGSTFNLHSAATATLSDLLVQYLPVVYPEGAFVAGLFHDVGKLLVATALPMECETLCSLALQQKSNMEECEMEVLGMTHAELSAAALKHWNLPLPVQSAVRRHHKPERAKDRRRPLSQVVHFADQCVNRFGMSILPFAGPDAGSPEESLEALELGERIPRVLEEFQTELQLIRSFF
jgi:HD-like signal output (HDOD) protein